MQNNIAVIVAMNRLYKRRKATFISTFDFSTFDFSTLHTEFPHNKFLMVLNILTDFCFDGGENKYFTINNYGACWVKNIKQQITDAVAYLLFNFYFTVGRKNFCQILVIPVGSDLAPFFIN